MRFDYTKGKTTKYVVTINAWNVSDKYFFSDLNDATRLYNEIINGTHDAGTRVKLRKSIFENGDVLKAHIF